MIRVVLLTLIAAFAASTSNAGVGREESLRFESSGPCYTEVQQFGTGMVLAPGDRNREMYRTHFGLHFNGPLIIAVERGTPAASAYVTQGFFVEGINGVQIRGGGPEAFRQAIDILDAVPPEGRVDLMLSSMADMVRELSAARAGRVAIPLPLEERYKKLSIEIPMRKELIKVRVPVSCKQ